MSNKVIVDHAAMLQLLQALVGPDHLIREILATVNLPELGGGPRHPLRQLIDDFNDPRNIVEEAQPGLQWSEPQEANEQVRYNHVSAATPFGRILITWKGWKDIPSYDIEELPGEEGLGSSHNTLERAKEAAQQQYWARVRQAVLGLPAPCLPDPPAEVVVDPAILSTPQS